MLNKDNIIISETNYQTIVDLLAKTATATKDFLEEELSRAIVVSQDQIPKDVALINSQVRFINLNSNKESFVKIVMPNQVDIEQSQISILAPVGAALIGLRVGQEVRWPLPNGCDAVLKVTSVTQVEE